VACAFTLSACGGVSPRSSPAPTPASPSATATVTALDRHAGVYRTAGGETYLLARSGLLVDTNTESVHSVTASGPDSLNVGPAFGETSPTAGKITFGGSGSGTLQLSWVGEGAVVATLVATTADDVHIPSDGAELAATVTTPAGSGRHPAIAIVHGSGRETRSMLDLWTELYVSLGFAVLAYDKRGVGESTGTYPGDLATTTTLDLLARDVEAVFTYLRSRPDVDPARTGLYGGSQGGWIVPLADLQARPSFAVIASGPPLTTGQQDAWSQLTGNGRQIPTESDAEIDAALRAANTGYDPHPVLSTDTTPTLWLFGAADRHVPTRLAVANLQALNHSNDTWQVFPRCSHNLLDTGTGLDADDASATMFGSGLFQAMAAFLARHAA